MTSDEVFKAWEARLNQKDNQLTTTTSKSLLERSGIKKFSSLELTDLQKKVKFL